jgi:hypothetical protein
MGELRFTEFYEDPVRTRRARSWELLRFLRSEFDILWLCARRMKDKNG